MNKDKEFDFYDGKLFDEISNRFALFSMLMQYSNNKIWRELPLNEIDQKGSE